MHKIFNQSATSILPNHTQVHVEDCGTLHTKVKQSGRLILTTTMRLPSKHLVARVFDGEDQQAIEENTEASPADQNDELCSLIDLEARMTGREESDAIGDV